MKKRLLALSLIALVAPITLAGCGNKDEKKQEEEPQLVEMVTLPISSANLILGETYKLTPKFETNAPTMPVISYVSSNSAIASVDDQGNILATGVGDAVVTVHFGGASATFNVGVSLKDCVPLIKLENFYTDDITLDLGSTIDLKAYVSFNTQKFDCDFTYKASSITAGSFDGTKYTPKKKGSIDITISGSFFGYQLASKVVHLNVKDVVSFSLTKKGDVQEVSSVYLYNYKQYGKYTYLTEFEFDCFVLDKGEQKEPTSIELIDNDEGAVIYDAANKKLTIKEKTVGTAKLRVSYTDKLGDTYVKDYPVSVNYSFVPYEEGEPIQTLETMVGEIDTSEIFGSFDPADRKITIAQSADGKKNYEVQDGKIVGLEDHGDTVQSIRIGNGLILKEIKFTTISKFIRTVEDLEYFRLVTDAEIAQNGSYCDKFLVDGKRVITGTFLLANNIDATGYTFKDKGRYSGASIDQVANYGFRGTFDGQGYTISNATFVRGGLFGVIGNDATVKNLGLSNVKFDQYNQEDRNALASLVATAVLKNVYVHSLKSGVANACGTVCHSIKKTAIVQNCLFVLDEPPADMDTIQPYGILASLATPGDSLITAGEDFLKDCYFVGNAPLLKNAVYQKSATKYYYDTKDINFDITYKETSEKYSKYVMPNATHYLTYADMSSAKETYSSFSDQYWEVIDDVLHFKTA